MLLKRLQKLEFVFCRQNCDNNIHKKCIKIWADHQDELENDSVVKCPLHRENFAPLRLILEEFKNSKQLVTATETTKPARDLGIPCNNCRVFSIIGNCYKYF